MRTSRLKGMGQELYLLLCPLKLTKSKSYMFVYCTADLAYACRFLTIGPGFILKCSDSFYMVTLSRA
jgi:hypothetical protein